MTARAPLLKFSAEQMLSSLMAKSFGGSRLPLETITEKGGAPVASVGHPIR